MRNWVILILFLSVCSNAFSVEFFFTSSPTGKGKISNKVKFSNSMTGLSHTAIYLPHACHDKSNNEKPNLIRLCGQDDLEKGLVVSFDFTLQKELNLFFMALKRSEFFYGTYKKGSLPSILSQSDVSKMDSTLINKYSYLLDENNFKKQIKKIIDLGIEIGMASKIIDKLLNKGPSKSNLNLILDQINIKLSLKKRKKILSVANYIFKKKITKRGLSRRSVSWGISYYKSIWSVEYPTTREEEKLIINHINSEWRNKKANLVSYNCVTPIMAISRILFGERPKRPSLVSLPYPLLKRIVSKVFKKKAHQRKNSFMRFYPKLETKIAKNTYPIPTSFTQDPLMVRFFKDYQGQLTNNINLDLKSLRKIDKLRNLASFKDLQKRRDLIFQMEKDLNLRLAKFDNDQIKNRGVIWKDILKIKKAKRKILIHYKLYKNKYSLLTRN